LKRDGLEVHHQGARHDVVNAVRLAVERARTGLTAQAEQAVVEHEGADDLLQRRATQSMHELPDLFLDEVRIAIALERKAPVELAAVERAEHVDLRLPDEGRTEELER